MDFIGAKDDGGGGDNWSYKTCEAQVEITPTNRHPVFLQAGLDALRVVQQSTMRLAAFIRRSIRQGFVLQTLLIFLIL